ncbi:hypothetical protein DUNSADRAFT_349 [Dunaliella salina]|uniref:RNA-editing substrate-binding complex 8 protein HEAT repeats domain-containing protein n=1 Tax=Dunaliella salina TaxID=3046 RepID=A0ABQ7FZ25_DUNSA|nr:hypothetical protein DUNSADRAFT_349 [Dunaliella salina]|eukprot:KAF5827611.1 hypothetical protein DUNSADRAFT_349 [Dunaliella salina]
MGGVGGGLMANAYPQAWSNSFNACAKLEQRGVRAGGGLGGGMSIITAVGASAMAGALQKPLHSQPDSQALANTLWGLSYFDWHDENIIRVLAHAMVQRINSSTSQGLSNVLWALAKFEWYDESTVSKLAAGMVEHIDSSEPQGLSNTLWALAKLGWYDEGVVSKLAAGVVEHIDSSEPQEFSNVLWALAKFGWYDKGVVSKLAAGMVERLASSEPQGLSNTLWALAKFGWYDESVVSKLAAAMVERIDSSKPQDFSNVLWALSTLRWYDSGVYDTLLVTLLDKRDQAAPQDFSNAIYSCALASHGGIVVDGLAKVISRQDVSKPRGWMEQALANSLYAWSVLGSIGIASDSLSAMAQHLMLEVNGRGPAAFQSLQLTQLYLAHLVAEQVGLQGGRLSPGKGGMLQAAAERHLQGQAELQKRAKQSEGAAGVHQAAAALQEAGYEVELGGSIGQDKFHAELLVRHESCPRGITVDILSSADVFHWPPGQLSGKARQIHAQIKQRCDGLVVLSEADAKQPGLVVQQVEKTMRGAAM